VASLELLSASARASIVSPHLSQLIFAQIDEIDCAENLFPRLIVEFDFESVVDEADRVVEDPK